MRVVVGTDFLIVFFFSSKNMSFEASDHGWIVYE